MSSTDFDPRLVLDEIRYKLGWHLKVSQCKVNQRFYLQWSFVGPCAVTGIHELQSCRKWWLSEFMTDGELVQTAFEAAKVAEEHECREFFLYKGIRIFGPHIRLDALMQAAEHTEVREYAGK